MKKLLEKLNLNIEVNKVERGKFYYCEEFNLLLFELINGCFKVENMQDFIEALWNKLKESVKNVQYFSLAIDKNADEKTRLEVFKILFNLNLSRKEYSFEVIKNSIVVDFKNNVNANYDKEMLIYMLKQLKLDSFIIREKKEMLELPKTKEKFTKQEDIENGKDYLLEELPINVEELERFRDDVKVKGEIFKIEVKNIKKKVLHSIYITNYKESVIVKYFDLTEQDFKIGESVVAIGRLQYDTYSKQIVLASTRVTKINAKFDKPKLNFEPEELQRCELHVHSNEDTEDAIPSVEDYYKNAKDLGINALAICNKENIQNFFEVERCSKEYGVKAIYGTEFKIIDDSKFKIFYNNEVPHSNSYVGLDIETTSLSNIFGDIIEISAYKRDEHNNIVDYSVLVNRESGDNTISLETEELTSITKEMLDNNGIDIKEALQGLMNFIGDSIIIAHNATFDVNFIEAKIKKHLKINKTYAYIDTMNFARVMLKGKSNYKLDTVANALGCSLKQHHRAIYDAKCCYDIFEALIALIKRTSVDSNNPAKENFFILRTTSEKALNFVNSKKYEIIKQEKVEGLKSSYETTIKVSGEEFELTLNELEAVPSLKITNIYAEDHNFNLKNLNDKICEEDVLKHSHYFTVTCLVKNQEGLKDLYKLISLSHTKRITRRGVVLFLSDIKKRDNLIFGSSGRSGVFENIYFDGFAKSLNLNFFDYIEINPKSAYMSCDDDINDDRIDFIIKNIIKVANLKNIPVVASTNAHYLYKEDKSLYEILNSTDLVGGVSHKYKKAKYSSDLPIYSSSNLFKQIKSDYNFADNEICNYIYNNPKKIADMISNEIHITPDKLYIPTETFLKGKKLEVLEGRNVDNIGKEFDRLISLGLEKYKYNGVLPKYIQDRVNKEVTPIKKYGYHIIYYISYLLVKKSLMDGYSVGSRGSVGSSFVANLMGITEVNALKPHYRCPRCNYQIYKDVESFVKIDSKKEELLRNNLNSVSSGFDLKEEKCPCCNEKMIRDGHDIPFETFLGFDGDKVPDIDLNFASVYQAKAHLFTKELFGEHNVVRAGTISKFAEKSALNMVQNYYNGSISEAEALRRSEKMLDIKRTTGQHASGIIIIPEGMEYEDFTPIQYPANDTEAWLTTHFEYSSIHDNLLKLDILGHVDPTMLRALMDEVKKNPNEYPFKTIQEIPFNDSKIYELLRKNDEEIINALGISEFGTNFVMGMLKKIDVNSFSDLVKVSGLSHGTDVWQNNGEDLVTGNTSFGEISFKETIGCRDDIMVQLMSYGLEPKTAFDIMEFVRKGKLHKGDTEKWEKYKSLMIEKNVPDWYIWSLSKIKYMFPKAHAIAYVMSAMRIAWFKAYKPLIFYKTYLTIRDKKFDVKTICSNDIDIIEAKISDIKNDKNAKPVDKDKLPMLEMAKEIINSGYKFLKPSINESSATEVLIKDNSLLLPFNMLDGVGDEIAKTIQNNRTTPYTSLEDLKTRGKANKKFIDASNDLNILKF